MVLLDNFSQESMDSFMVDISLVIFLLKNIDQEYADAKQEFIHDFSHFKIVIKKWNEKYPLVKMTLFEGDMQLQLKVVIKDSLQGVVQNAVTIENFVSINGNRIALGERLPPIGNEAELVYAEMDGNEDSVTFRAVEEGVQLEYTLADMLNVNKAEFMICCHYALSQKNRIDLNKYGSFFSFKTDIWSAEGRGINYLDRVRIFVNR